MTWFSRISNFFSARKPSTNRKYTDLIFRETSFWATFTPFEADPLEVGDYGLIDKETGEFVCQGNIYKDEAIITQFPQFKDEEYQPKSGQTLDKWLITSQTGRKVDASLAPEARVSGAFDASINIEISFDANKRGAYLILYRPRTTELPKNILLQTLSSFLAFKEGKRYLVTKVVSCPAYALEVSNKTATTARVRFVGQLPLTAVPGVTAGGEVAFGWQNEYTGSSHQEGCNKAGRPVYHPLYALKRVAPKISPETRQAEEPMTGDDMWLDVVPPWAPLDDDGNEVANEYADEIEDDE